MPFKRYEKANCSEIIEKVHQNYKAMAYSLKRLMCREEDTHIQLTTGPPQQIDVIANTFMYFKISVQNKMPPGRLQIQYASGLFIAGAQSSDLTR